MTWLWHKLTWFAGKVIAHERAHPFFTYPIFLVRVWICKRRYQRTMVRLARKRAAGEKIRVLFLNANCSKWKCQSVYDLMKGASEFDPVIGLTFCDDELHFTDEALSRRIASDRSFFERNGCKCVMACNVESRQVLAPSEFGADIVFMAVPWGVLGCQNVFPISKYALTCYVPYGIDFTEFIGKSLRFNWHHLAYFHLLMWRCFTWSESYADYIRAPHYWFERAGDWSGIGHAALDVLQSPEVAKEGELVIYAPHFSFVWGGMRPIDLFSTFDWSGKPMLEYAKSHPEIKWAFKPHPMLRKRMVENGFMTEAEAQKYYDDWNRIAVSCYDGGYASLFARSRAMITDCCSFLMEYAATGKPLVRLMPQVTNQRISPPAERVVSLHYTCRDLDEMHAVLKRVVEDRQDPRREERRAAAKDAGLFGNKAAERICGYLREKLD